MRRREFITLFGGTAIAWPLAARAQPTKKIPIVGVLWHACNAEQEGSNFTSLMEGFTKLGYVDGRNIKFEHRFANEIPDRFRSLAAELVLLNVDVFVVVGNNAAPYARDATKIIPIVFTLVGDPIGLKLVDSFARTNGNVTGLSNFTAELIAKRLQLLKEMVPGLSRVAILANANAQISRLYIDLSQAAAVQLGLTVSTFEVHSSADLEPAFEAMVAADMQAVTANADGLASSQKEIIAKLALARRLPLAVWSRDTLDAGALMSYGADSNATCRGVAVYVDKILKGAKPSELPVEQATRFQFFINNKTAKALGLTIPPTLIATADEVIE
jgi:putative tryptophan/tyrosine transport system substrate-binding protein